MKKSKRLSVKIITLFPKFIEDFVGNFGIVKRAIKLRLLDIKPISLRNFGLDERKTVDNPPYGGGAGMVLRADVLLKAIKKATGNPEADASRRYGAGRQEARVVLLTPQGKKFDQSMAHRLAKYDQLIFVCGRYEGFDERVRKFVDEEISIGDYVLMGGELPALVISEAVMRLRPGILGKIESTEHESFAEELLEYPQYTKPEKLVIKLSSRKSKVLAVPKVLLTGHHKNINEWREKEALKRTEKRRPDLLK